MRIGKVTGTTTSYYQTHALGSTRLVTSSSGSVTFADDYKPFGQDIGTPTRSEVYKFTGKPVSRTTGSTTSTNAGMTRPLVGLSVRTSGAECSLLLRARIVTCLLGILQRCSLTRQEPAWQECGAARKQGPPPPIELAAQ